MEKKTILANVNYSFSWGTSTLIETIEEDLKALKERGATHIDIEVNEEWGESPYAECSAYLFREETDEEFNLRLSQEEERKSLLAKKELEMLEALKLKYETKDGGAKKHKS